MRQAIILLTGVVSLVALYKGVTAGTTSGSLMAFVVFAGCGAICFHFVRELLNENRSQLPPMAGPAPQPAPSPVVEQAGRFSESPFRRDYSQDPSATATPSYVPPAPAVRPAQPYVPPPPLPQQSYPQQAPAPQMPVQHGPDSSGVGAALGGAALGGMLGYSLGGAAAARAAHSAGRGRDTQYRDTGPDNSGLLPPVDGDDLDHGSSGLGAALAGGAAGTAAGAASGLLPPVDADDVGGASSGLLPTEDADQAGNGSGAASGLLPAVDGDEATSRTSSGLLAPEDADQAASTGSSGLYDPVDASELDERDPSPAPQDDEDAGYRGSTGLLSPIAAEEAETRYAPDPEPYRYDPPAREPDPDPPASDWGSSGGYDGGGNDSGDWG